MDAESMKVVKRPVWGLVTGKRELCVSALTKGDCVSVLSCIPFLHFYSFDPLPGLAQTQSFESLIHLARA